MTHKRETKFWLESFFPTTIIQDRYNGTYSGAVWLAFPLDFWNVPDEVEGGDGECMMFWESYDGEVGKGSTPELAMANLVAKMSGVSDKQFAQVHMEDTIKLKAENKALKRQIGWMQETINKLHMENFESDFGKKYYGDDDSRAE